MSVIFSAALLGLGRAAAAAYSAGVQLMPLHLEFELSQDGETIWEGIHTYDFVGFASGDDCSRVCADDGFISIGRKLGSVANDDFGKVRQLNTMQGNYIIVLGSGDEGEIFKRR